MKAKKYLIVVALLVLSLPSFAGIEGLKLSIQSANAVLQWPSGTNDIYCVQYRATLNPEDTWQTLTNAFPSAVGTNWTTFIHTNAVCTPPAGEGGGSGGGSPPSLQGSSSFSSQSEKSGSFPPLPPAPPLPWETSKSNVSRSENSSSASGAEGEGDGGGFSSCAGFYRVWHVPNFPASITNYVFDGPIFLPVDFEDYRDHVATTELLFDGQPTLEAEFMPYIISGQTNWGMGIYFDRFTNGTHQLQLVTTLQLTDEIGDSSVYVVLSNRVKSVVVSNAVAFPDWNDVIQGDTYTFTAKIANPNTDWTIDIFDAGENYVNSGSGHTTNGLVSWTWNLTDYLNNNRDDFDNDPFFYSQITFDDGGSGGGAAAASGSVTKPTPPPVKGFPNRGEWIISYQDRWYTDATNYPSDLQGKYLDAVDAIGGGPILLNEQVNWFSLHFGTNVWTQAEREYSWTNMLSWMKSPYIRNFYYHGHGGAKAIGCDRHTYGTNGLITGGTFTSSKSKSQIASWQIAGISKLNRYRFVYLDGCSTAAGDLPNSFNVSKEERENTDFYENHPKHPRPSVFVGWNQTVGGDATWGTAYDRIEFQSFWMGNWVNDNDRPGIKEALRRANVGSGWIGQQKLDNTLRTYGYSKMKARDYNQKGDWRWP